MNDILDAVPIDKYFELFKPGAGGEGGFIRIGMNFTKALKDRSSSAGARPAAARLLTCLAACRVRCMYQAEAGRACLWALGRGMWKGAASPRCMPIWCAAG